MATVADVAEYFDEISFSKFGTPLANAIDDMISMIQRSDRSMEEKSEKIQAVYDLLSDQQKTNDSITVKEREILIDCLLEALNLTRALLLNPVAEYPRLDELISGATPLVTPEAFILTQEHLRKREMDLPEYEPSAKIRQHILLLDGQKVKVVLSANPSDYESSHPNLFKKLLQNYDVVISLDSIQDLDDKSSVVSELDNAIATGTVKHYGTVVRDQGATLSSGANMDIRDHEAVSFEQFALIRKVIEDAAAHGKSVMVHCGAGCGRSGHVMS